MCKRTTIASFFSFFCSQFLHLIFPRHLYIQNTEKKMFDHAVTTKKSILLSFTNLRGIWAKTTVFKNDQCIWNWIFKTPCLKIYAIPSTNFSTWLSWRKCEHELILFECKINYAKKFELIRIAIYIYIITFCFISYNLGH